MKQLRNIIKEYKEATKLLKGVEGAIWVIGSARTPQDAKPWQIAWKLGREAGKAGIPILTGGGGGIMEAAAEGARSTGAVPISLGIQLPFEVMPQKGPQIAKIFKYFVTRKLFMVKRTRALVCMPGGWGTFDELFEVLTLMQTGKIRTRPVILVGKKYWTPLLDFLRDTVLADGYTSLTDTFSLDDIIMVEDDMTAVVNHIRYNSKEGL